MDLDQETFKRLMDAGVAAVRFNSPMDGRRAHRIGDFLSRHAGTVVDLGCGRGALAVDIAVRHPEMRITAIDIDAEALEHGRTAASERGVADRVGFQRGDVTESISRVDAAVCIGSSHAFGGPAPTMGRLAEVASSAAVVGDLMWAEIPTQIHLDFFGDLPLGEQSLADMAVAAGWTVVDVARSSLAEWDAFEGVWIDGVRRLGGHQAAAFADERQRMYDSYRGVAGFGWLFLTR